MNKAEFIQSVEKICPLQLAESWDNCGFQINDNSDTVNNVLIAMEITDEVIDEAIEAEADLIITHHPLIFGGVRNVSEKDVIGNYIFRLIRNRINVYSCHTNFDKAEGGNNDYIGRILDLDNVRPFSDDNGFCRMGDTPFETTFAEIIHNVSEAFQIEEKYFKAVGDLKKSINTIGWCSGAGSEFIESAAKEGCDLYITGDLKYHDAQHAKEAGLCILDAGHYGSEKIFAENMAELIRRECREKNVNIIESVIDINPFI